MRIQVLSDLHFEFHHDAGCTLVNDCHVPDVDVLVLAGDIAVAEGIPGALAVFSERYPHVVYVHGNHELYGTTRDNALELTHRACARYPNVHFLDCDVVTIGGQRFVGTPLWFASTPASRTLTRMLNDFSQIADYETWVYDEHLRARSFLEREAGPGDVVVTHHLPSHQSVLPKYREHPLTCYFVADMEHIIEAQRPALWIHGHTHGSVDLQVGETRLLCNPFGYVRIEENASFQPHLVVEP